MSKWGEFFHFMQRCYECIIWMDKNEAAPGTAAGIIAGLWSALIKSCGNAQKMYNLKKIRVKPIQVLSALCNMYLSLSITLSWFGIRSCCNGEVVIYLFIYLFEKGWGEWTESGEQLQRWAKTLCLPMHLSSSIFLIFVFLEVKDSLCCSFQCGLFCVTYHNIL